MRLNTILYRYGKASMKYPLSGLNILIFKKSYIILNYNESSL